MTHSDGPSDITVLLRSIARRSGSADTSDHLDRLFKALHGELRAVAGNLMRHERPDHTLQPTALVNEAFLKLVGNEHLSWENRAHFFSTAARAMRQVLVEYARQHNALKRGGQWSRVSLSESLALDRTLDVEIMDLHNAIEKLEKEDSRAAQVVEMWFFGGLEQKDIAYVLGITDRTVRNDWNFARLWLARELDPET